LTAPADALDLRVAEYTGLDAFADWASNSGESTSVSAIVNAAGGARLAVVGAASEGRITSATGVTLRVTTMPYWNVEGDFPVAEAGPYSAMLVQTPAVGLSQVWVVNWLTFR
jgi:hypothetical protein